MPPTASAPVNPRPTQILAALAIGVAAAVLVLRWTAPGDTSGPSEEEASRRRPGASAAPPGARAAGAPSAGAQRCARPDGRGQTPGSAEPDAGFRGQPRRRGTAERPSRDVDRDAGPGRRRPGAAGGPGVRTRLRGGRPRSSSRATLGTAGGPGVRKRLRGGRPRSSSAHPGIPVARGNDRPSARPAGVPPPRRRAAADGGGGRDRGPAWQRPTGRAPAGPGLRPTPPAIRGRPRLRGSSRPGDRGHGRPADGGEPPGRGPNPVARTPIAARRRRGRGRFSRCQTRRHRVRVSAKGRPGRRNPRDRNAGSGTAARGPGAPRHVGADARESSPPGAGGVHPRVPCRRPRPGRPHRRGPWPRTAEAWTRTSTTAARTWCC